jgi:hypothetical protein
MHIHDHDRASLATTASAPAPGAGLWPAPQIILEHVAATYRISVQHLQSKKRDLLTVEAKRVTIHLLAASGLGASAIGRQIHLDHSTVLHHLRHAPLDRWQQQLVGDLEVELQRMAARVPTPHRGPARRHGRSQGSSPAPPIACDPRTIPTLGKHSDHLQTIYMPCR